MAALAAAEFGLAPFEEGSDPFLTSPERLTTRWLRASKSRRPSKGRSALAWTAALAAP